MTDRPFEKKVLQEEFSKWFSWVTLQKKQTGR